MNLIDKYKEIMLETVPFNKVEYGKEPKITITVSKEIYDDETNPFYRAIKEYLTNMNIIQSMSFVDKDFLAVNTKNLDYEFNDNNHIIFKNVTIPGVMKLEFKCSE